MRAAKARRGTLLAILLPLMACTGVPVHGADHRASVPERESGHAEDDRWARCAMPGCLLRTPSAVSVAATATAAGIRMLHSRTEVGVEASRSPARALAGGVTGWLGAQRSALALAARFTAAPEPHCCRVRGITGIAAPAAGALIDADPQRVHLATRENPAPDGVLLLRMTGPGSSRAEAWPSPSRVVAETRLDADF